MQLERPVDSRQDSAAAPSAGVFVVSAVAAGLLLAIGLLGARSWMNETIAETVAAAVAKHQPPPPAPPEAKDITTECREIVRQEAAQFVLANMTKTPSFPDKFALLAHSVNSVPPELKGLYCEFGVYKGETVNF